MKTVVRDFSYRGEHFSIVYDGKFYMTVNHKLIDADGHPIRTLIFTDLHPGKTLEETMRLTRQDLDLKHYEATGMSKAEAFAKVMEIPLEIAQELFG